MTRWFRVILFTLAFVIVLTPTMQRWHAMSQALCRTSNRMNCPIGSCGSLRNLQRPLEFVILELFPEAVNDRLLAEIAHE